VYLPADRLEAAIQEDRPFTAGGDDVSRDFITPIMGIQIELALANARGDLDALRSLEAKAKHMALSGAEIDAAKRGGSFDLFIDIAVKFALAILAGDEAASAAARQKLTIFQAPEIASELPGFVGELARRHQDKT
jgi:hypothetical protein